MNEIVLHSLQSILSAGLFILIYRLFVRNTNAYNWNRCYLLSTMILSLFLPFIDISNWFTVDQPIVLYTSLIDFNQMITKIDVNQVLTTVTPVQQVQTSLNLSDLILTGYGLIVGLFLLRFGWGILRIVKLARNNNYSIRGNLRLYPIQRKTTFSFFNYIFIQPEHWKNPAIDYIIRHEQAHVNQLHTIDNILTELILVFGWFNPFYYIYRNDLHLLHECQADQAVINSGCNQTTYHQMLLNEVSGNLTYIIVNQFSYSLIKRRFKMISKNKQSRLAGFRILLAIPTALVLLLMFSFTSLEKTTSLLQNDMLQPALQAVQSSLDNLQNPQQKPIAKQTVTQTIKSTPPVIAKDTTKKIKFTPPIVLSDETITLDQIVVTGFAPSASENLNKKDKFQEFQEVSKRPEFPGGYTALSKFLRDNIQYPAEAQKNNITGTVFVQFEVKSNGEVKDAKILRGIGKSCDDEALRIVNLMPLWSPGTKEGKPVNTNFAFPIKFQLQKK